MCPNTSRFCGRVAKLQKLLSVLGQSRKKIQISLLRRLGSETTDFCLIRARKMAQLVGLDRSKQKPYLQRNHTFSRLGR
jgi:hypothetical protein